MKNLIQSVIQHPCLLVRLVRIPQKECSNVSGFCQILNSRFQIHTIFPDSTLFRRIQRISHLSKGKESPAEKTTLIFFLSEGTLLYNSSFPKTIFINCAETSHNYIMHNDPLYFNRSKIPLSIGSKGISRSPNRCIFSQRRKCICLSSVWFPCKKPSLFPLERVLLHFTRLAIALFSHSSYDSSIFHSTSRTGWEIQSRT